MKAIEQPTSVVDEVITEVRFVRASWICGPGFVASGRGGFTVLER